ncbi:hypothetical protein [Desulfosarcina alkanivorans]|uniref:hypothetical protein n=1 Tax=Desulfosarcina alkanivorans TaxID=571177 RepID=UPI0012D31A67|nr:hypothetical protein [Desulfosarcina alkanivorans]
MDTIFSDRFPWPHDGILASLFGLRLNDGAALPTGLIAFLLKGKIPHQHGKHRFLVIKRFQMGAGCLQHEFGVRSGIKQLVCMDEGNVIVFHAVNDDHRSGDIF